jgi:hypothetical protein
MSLKRANAHFSDDLLSSLLNEPIPGQGVFWSSVGGKPYPVSLRALSFEKMFSMRDPDYNQPTGRTYAQTLRSIFSGMRQIATTARIPEAEGAGASFPEETEVEETEPMDVMANIEQKAIEALRANAKLMAKIESSEGAAWGSLKAFFLDHLPAHLDDRDTLAFRLVKKALVNFYGPQDQGWEQYRHPTRNTAYVRKRS